MKIAARYDDADNFQLFRAGDTVRAATIMTAGWLFGLATTGSGSILSNGWTLRRSPAVRTTTISLGEACLEAQTHIRSVRRPAFLSVDVFDQDRGWQIALFHIVRQDRSNELFGDFVL
jgi:hypothetical protein